ncbi:MAG: Crp/Fnr family transcriptional regulator [Firmicutes bacterium HGW-Firmicutes-7]|nr:MAG: Crp/Fnr family transcriptional regulator [Firmicutes bacterium HGW-Firmicutes-7]
MNAIQAALKNSHLLSSLSSEDINTYIHNNQFNIIHYGKNNIIHFDGDACHHLEILLSGKIVVERIDEVGNLMIIAEFFPDDVLGGNLLFSKNSTYPMTVTAQTAVTILEINKNLLFELCFINRDFLKSFLEIISDHTILLGDKIKYYVNRSIRDSIIAFLKTEYLKQNTLKIILTTTKKALANRIGVQRTSLSRELQKMKQEGLLLVDSASITILDPLILK